MPLKPVFEDTAADLSDWTFPEADEAFDTKNLRPLLKALVLDAFEGDGLGKSQYGKEADEHIDQFMKRILSSIATTIDYVVKEETTIRLWQPAEGKAPEIGVDIPLAGDGLFCSLPLSALVEDYLQDRHSKEVLSLFAATFREAANMLDEAANKTT